MIVFDNHVQARDSAVAIYDRIRELYPVVWHDFFPVHSLYAIKVGKPGCMEAVICLEVAENTVSIKGIASKRALIAFDQWQKGSKRINVIIQPPDPEDPYTFRVARHRAQDLPKVLRNLKHLINFHVWLSRESALASG
jgi:hypothetical protein